MHSCSFYSLLIAASVAVLPACKSGNASRETPSASKVSATSALQAEQSPNSPTGASDANLGQAPSEPSVAVATPKLGSVRWIAAGGGSLPSNNQISLEADLALASNVFGPPAGILLYAGGADTQAVQVASPEPPSDTLRAELAMIFSPRGPRDVRYQKTTLNPSGAASAESVLQSIETAVTAPLPTTPVLGEPAATSTTPPSGATASTSDDESLTVFLATHGDQGETPPQNAVMLWGGWPLTVRDIAQVLDKENVKRTSRFVITSCFSGGFADLVFRDADVTQGAAASTRCGFFSTTWDREATGCDPDPNRRMHEGYGVHFLNALRGVTRDGQPIPRETLDLDHNGKISLLEAHSYVRIATRTMDIPTTTSERWLRAFAPDRGPKRPVALPEEDAVIAALSRLTNLPAEIDAVRTRVNELNERIESLTKQREPLAQAEEESYLRIAARLLTRWPVLDDPWHAAFEATLQRDRQEIRRFLDALPEYSELVRQIEATGTLEEQLNTLSLNAAPIERLMRALENKERAERLSARGDAAWKYYERVLHCERGTLASNTNANP